MEKDNEMMKSKKKFPLSLIVCLAIVICALCAIGVKVLKVEDTNSGKETTKEIVVSDGDEIKVSDEETLRELLAKDETLSLVIKKDIYTSKPFTINGTKTLTGEGSIIMRLDAEAKKDLCVVSKGAELILDGATIDGNGVATGVHVQSGGKFKGLSGEILYGMPYGIQTAGVVEIEDITIDRAMHTALLVSTGGEAYMTGGKITNCIETGVAVAMKAYAKISGNAVLEGSAGSLAYNYGVLDITGGKLSGSTANTIFNKSELNIISESDKLVEICDSKGSAISAVGGTTVNIDGLYIHDVAKHGLNLEKEGTGVVKNCTIERLGRMGLYVATSSVMEIENVTIKEGKYRGIVNNDGTVTVKNADISDMEGAGIITAGKKSETTLEDIVITKVAKSGLGVTGGKVTAKNLTISEAAGSGINITTAAGTTEITDAAVTKSGKNGLAMTIGKLTAKNLMIDGSTGNGVYLGQKAVVNLTDTNIKNSGIHAIGNYGGKLTTKKLAIDKTERGGIVSKGGTVTCDNTEISNTGSRAVNIMENCKATMTALKVKNVGNTAIYADSGSFKLTDYEVDQVKGHGMQLQNSEKTVVQNGKVSNTTKSGIFVGEKSNATFEDTSLSKIGEQGFAVYHGTVTVRNLKIEETGKGGLISEAGTIKGNTVAISKTGSRAINLKDNSNAGITVLTIEKACANISAEDWSAAIWVEDSKGDFTDFTITSLTHVGVQVKGNATTSLYKGKIDAMHQGICVAEGADAEAQSVIIERMEGNAQPLINVDTGSTFTLKKDSVVDGNGYPGRGVRVVGSMTMNDGVVRDNHYTGKEAGSGDEAGGGVYVAGSFVMNGGTIEKNMSTIDGAGVHVKEGGKFTFAGGTVQNNHADKCGAGVSVRGAFTMTGGTIQNNDATNHGAGVMIRKTALITMTGGTIKANTTNGNGGGIYIQSESSDDSFVNNIHGGTIIGNTATNGGGIFVNTNKNVSLKNVTIQNNTATKHGGGVYAEMARAFDMESGTIVGNTAVDGGGVYTNNKGIFTMKGGSIEGNTATGTQTVLGKGSGVCVAANANKPFTMTGGTISGHGTETARSSSQGAGVYVAADSVFNMNGANAVVENNYSSQVGAGVAVIGTFTMSNGKIQGNNTTGNGAGVLVIKDTGVFTMSGGTIANNTTSKSGGGIFTQSTSTTITGGTIENNTATVDGGGVYVHTAGILTMEGGTVKNNTATRNGGGIYVATTVNNATNKIAGSVIQANTATDGGGVYLNTSKAVTMSNMTIQSNTATQNGGGVYVYSTSSFKMASGTITANTAINGGGVYTYNKGVFTQAGGSITNNTATGNGSGVCVAANNNKPFTMTGGTISEHGTEAARSNSQGAGVYVASGSVFNMNGANAVIENNYTTQNGAGVYVASTQQDDGSYVVGTFTMSAGTIQGNDSALNGGGVFMDPGVAMTMTGGKIVNNHCTKNGGAICAAGSNVITLQAGEISGNTADGTVQGVFLQSAGATSKAVLYTTFTMGNEIRYNSLSNRGTDNPVLLIKGASLGYDLNLGFHKSGGNKTVYIECDSAEAAAAIYEKLTFFKTTKCVKKHEAGSKYITITVKS